MILAGIEFREWMGNRLNWHVKCDNLGYFNLLIGDNAQGKTRLFNFMRFVRDIDFGFRPISPSLKVDAHFLFTDNRDSVKYSLILKMGPDGIKPIFNEIITRNDKTLFSSEGRTLLDENKDDVIKDFFIPNNLSVLSSLNGKEEFKTIGQVCSFFGRMIFLEENRFSSTNLALSGNSIVINYAGSNTSDVLANWRKNGYSRQAYENVMEEFRKSFELVESVDVKPRQLPGLAAPVNLAAIREPNNPNEILQNDWSDGMLRVLCLLALPATRFPQAQGDPLSPSLVFIDEIENGLDFKTLRRLIDYYREHSNITQSLIISHSPLVCNMVSPRNWKVAKRDGAKVVFVQPDEKERDLEGERQDLLIDNWEFYRRNVATKKTSDGN
jgi:hypothetical protein